MPRLIQIPKISDERGSLSVINQLLPFDIKRIFYIYNVSGSRGGHRHKETFLALICIHGSCSVKVENPNEKNSFLLDSKDKCLIVDNTDWHTMDNFSDGTVLLALASEYYDEEDYIYEPYQ